MAEKLSLEMSGSDLDVQHLPSAIHTCLRVYAMRTEGAAVRILGELGSDIGIAGSAIGAAALGLFAFRIGHKEGGLVECGWLVKTSVFFCIKTRVVRLPQVAVKSYSQDPGRGASKQINHDEDDGQCETIIGEESQPVAGDEMDQKLDRKEGRNCRHDHAQEDAAPAENLDHGWS